MPQKTWTSRRKDNLVIDNIISILIWIRPVLRERDVDVRVTFLIVRNMSHSSCENLVLDIRVLPKVDHSGNEARIVLEQNKFSKKSYLKRGLNLWTYDCNIYSPIPIPYPSKSIAATQVKLNILQSTLGN